MIELEDLESTLRESRLITKEALWELQSAFFRCDELFEEAISEEELKSYVDQ